MDGTEGHTWGHVKRGTATEIRGEVIRGRQTKVGEFDGQPMVGGQDVLRLQIPVVDTHGVAEMHGVQNLEKSTFGQWIVPGEVPLVGDAGEEVALGTELDHHVGAVRGVHNAHQGNHIGMLAGQMVQANLPLLELQLARTESGLVESLDGVHDMGVDIDGGVDDAISADAQNAGEFQTVGENVA